MSTVSVTRYASSSSVPPTRGATPTSLQNTPGSNWYRSAAPVTVSCLTNPLNTNQPRFVSGGVIIAVRPSAEPAVDRAEVGVQVGQVLLVGGPGDQVRPPAVQPGLRVDDSVVQVRTDRSVIKEKERRCGRPPWCGPRPLRRDRK